MENKLKGYKMKKFIIQIKVNPNDEFVKYKQFDSLERANQSLDTLKKHTYNLFKNSEYIKFRIYDKNNNIYYNES